MKIGELAATAHTQNETIRYYEREGLLGAPTRSDSNYRVYGAAHVERLSFIRHCRGLDMTLAEIRVLLKFKDAPTENCAEVNALLDRHIGHVAERVKELRSLEKQLKALRQTCKGSQDAEHCGILNELIAIANGPMAPPPRTGHLQGVHGRQAVERAVHRP